MKRKFSPLPEYQEAPQSIAIPGEYPVKWLNPHGMVVVERCYSAATQQWTIAHRQNVVTENSHDLR